MKMQKGLCIQLNDESSIFLGPGGEFVQGKPVGEMAVGEQGYFYPQQAKAVKKGKRLKPVWASVFAVLAVAILSLSILMPEKEAFAYVQVQVNPGIELGIDDSYKVISIRGLNDDGRKLIDELAEWEDHSLEEVLGSVVNLSVKETTDEIVITTVTGEEDKHAGEEITDSVMAVSTAAVAGNVTVRLKEASKKQWRTSVEQKVPVGQMIRHSETLQEEKPKEEKVREPLPVKGPEPAAEPSQQDTPREDEKTGKENEPDKKADDKHRNTEEKGRDKERGISPETEKPATPGQEKRQETPAAEKGAPSPPGHDKRSPGPPQDKAPASSKQPEDKGKGQAPGQQKKKENNGKGNAPQPKAPVAKPEPKNTNGKSNSGKQGPPPNKGGKAEPRNNNGNNEKRP